MNEIIKEFMKQSGTDTSGKWMGVENAEKFAELIVRECAEICLEANDHKNILQHFGFEK